MTNYRLLLAEPRSDCEIFKLTVATIVVKENLTYDQAMEYIQERFQPGDLIQVDAGLPAEEILNAWRGRKK